MHMAVSQSDSAFAVGESMYKELLKLSGLKKILVWCMLNAR